MSISRKLLKYLPGILIILLFIFVLLTFRSYQNMLVHNGVNDFPTWAVFFQILISIIGVLFYFLLINAFGKFKGIENEVKSLKRYIEQTKREEEKQEEVFEERMDAEMESSALIPDNREDIIKFGETLLSNIAHKIEIVQGLVYLKDPVTGIFSFSSGYAYYSESEPVSYKEGETLSGQVAKNKRVLNLYPVPDDYITILSGTGKGSPKHLMIIPIVTPDNETTGIIEVASFKAFGSEYEQLFELLGKKVGKLLSASINNRA